MEDALPLVGVSSMGYSNSPSPHLGNVEEPGSVAASFAVTAVPPVGGISQRPVSLRVFIKVGGKKEGIFAEVISIPARIVEHRKARSEERRVGKECRSRWSP